MAAGDWATVVLTKFCFKHAPGFMAYHLFEAVKLQISIFFEFTFAVNYVLTVAEEGGDFRKILMCMGILMGAIAVSTVTFAIYKHYVFPRGKQTLYQALRMEIYEKSNGEVYLWPGMGEMVKVNAFLMIRL